MFFIDAEGNYPKYIADVQTEIPGWEEGQAIPLGWKLVEESDVPVAGENQKIVEGFPEEIDGVWKRSWSVVDMTEDELQIKNAPSSARSKLVSLGFTNQEIDAISRGLV